MQQQQVARGASSGLLRARRRLLGRDLGVVKRHDEPLHLVRATSQRRQVLMVARNILLVRLLDLLVVRVQLAQLLLVGVQLKDLLVPSLEVLLVCHGMQVWVLI